MKIAIDTNVLVYGEGSDDQRRRVIARSVLDASATDVAFPVQVLGEFFNVMTRKLREPASVTRRTVEMLRASFEVLPTTPASLDRAIELAEAHRLHIWDAIILAVAAEARCALLLTEDMQDGFAWSGVTVVNPFVEPMPAILLRAIQS